MVRRGGLSEWEGLTYCGLTLERLGWDYELGVRFVEECISLRGKLGAGRLMFERP